MTVERFISYILMLESLYFFEKLFSLILLHINLDFFINYLKIRY